MHDLATEQHVLEIGVRFGNGPEVLGRPGLPDCLRESQGRNERLERVEANAAKNVAPKE